MESENPSLSFQLEYAGEMIDCEVIMDIQSYDIKFNGRWMASIAHTDEWTWIQESGVILPKSIVNEIGFKIESEYE